MQVLKNTDIFSGIVIGPTLGPKPQSARAVTVAHLGCPKAVPELLPADGTVLALAEAREPALDAAHCKLKLQSGTTRRYWRQNVNENDTAAA